MPDIERFPFRGPGNVAHFSKLSITLVSSAQRRPNHTARRRRFHVHFHFDHNTLIKTLRIGPISHDASSHHDLTARIYSNKTPRRARQRTSVKYDQPEAAYYNMVRGEAAPEKMHEELRLDSGAALSDPAALSGGSAQNGKLTMPTLRNTNWNYGAPKARYRGNELQLQQPKGFPIKVLKSTLKRARKKAELEAAVRRYAGPDFEIYEDLEEDDYDVKIEDEDEEAEDIAEDATYDSADESADDSAEDSADDSADDSDASAELPTPKVNTEKPAAPVDSRGRTRAATTRRKAQEASESTMPSSVSSKDMQNATVGNRERKRGSTQAAKQPRKTQSKKSD